MKLFRYVLIIVLGFLCVVPSQARKKKGLFDRETVAIPAVEPQVIAVETDNSQLVLQVDEKGNVRICHYGSRVQDPQQFAQYTDGYICDNDPGPLAYPYAGGMFTWRPAIGIEYKDGTCVTELYYTGHEKSGGKTVLHMKDYVTEMYVDLVYEAYPKEDVIVAHSEIRNGGKDPVKLTDFASAYLILNADKYLFTHFYGWWAEEMQVDREILGHDTKVLESRRGVQNTQINNPSFLLSLDTEQWSETSGEVVAGALAWSGNWRIAFEKTPSGLMNISAGINPASSAYPLKAGDTFITPDFIYTWSGCGAGQASRNMHRYARKHRLHDGANIHPTLLNSWEGAYFTFRTPVLTGMIDDAADMGLEMFVLDDGWFGTDYPRNGDNAGLGDWEPNLEKIPEGIDYVATYAHDKGLKFGIWIEPEMANPESRLAKAHPDWLVKSPGRENYTRRNQWILDLSNPAVQDFVFGVFDYTMKLSPNIDYVKWDCNRLVMSFGSQFLDKEQQRFYIEYIQGLYKVMRRIRERYPSVIVQCCSAGGARVDYGALTWFDEIWASDNSDAVSRAFIQYGTSLIYPACIMGAHVSTVPNHQTGNVTPLKFRFDMACAGRLGMELQPKSLTADERALADRCIKSYKSWRDVVFEGDLYRLASPYDGNYYAQIYVTEDKSRAVVFVYCLKYRNELNASPVFKLDGLDPGRMYRVTEQNVDSSCWWGDGGTYSGEFLQAGGFNPRLFKPLTSAVFLLEAR